MENSITKQNRFGCNVGRGIDNWSCYTDCGFWNRKICTLYEEKSEEGMKRLTYWNEEYGCWSYKCASGDAAKCLAAYEDTGLTPEQIEAQQQEIERLKAQAAVKDTQLRIILENINKFPPEGTTIGKNIWIESTKAALTNNCFYHNPADTEKIKNMETGLRNAQSLLNNVEYLIQHPLQVVVTLSEISELLGGAEDAENTQT